MRKRSAQRSGRAGVILSGIVCGGLILAGCGASAPSSSLAAGPVTQRVATLIVVGIHGQTLIGRRFAPQRATVRLQITPHTTIWDNGHMVSYHQSPGVTAHQTVLVHFQTRPSGTTVQQIYGPWRQVSGIIKTVSRDQITIQEMRAGAPAHQVNPGGSIQQLLYNQQTTFSGAPSHALEPGRLIQCQTVGFLPGKLLIMGLSIYRQTGPQQWVQVGHTVN